MRPYGYDLLDMLILQAIENKGRFYSNPSDANVGLEVVFKGGFALFEIVVGVGVGSFVVGSTVGELVIGEGVGQRNSGTLSPSVPVVSALDSSVPSKVIPDEGTIVEVTKLDGFSLGNSDGV